jgi:hypothetical protein
MAWTFITVPRPAKAIVSAAMFLGAYFFRIALASLASAVPPPSDWNDCAKYRPFSALPAEAMAGGDVQGSIPAI